MVSEKINIFINKYIGTMKITVNLSYYVQQSRRLKINIIKKYEKINTLISFVNV